MAASSLCSTYLSPVSTLNYLLPWKQSRFCFIIIRKLISLRSLKQSPRNVQFERPCNVNHFRLAPRFDVALWKISFISCSKLPSDVYILRTVLLPSTIPLVTTVNNCADRCLYKKIYLQLLAKLLHIYNVHTNLLRFRGSAGNGGIGRMAVRTSLNQSISVSFIASPNTAKNNVY